MPLETTISDCRALVDGEYDDVPEPAFLLKGNMETVLAAAKKMAAEFAEQVRAGQMTRSAERGSPVVPPAGTARSGLGCVVVGDGPVRITSEGVRRARRNDA